MPESAPKQHKGLARSLSVMQSKTYADTLMQFRKAVETIKARGIDDGLHVGTYPASYWDKVAAQPGGPEVIKIAFAQIKKNGRPLKEADAVNVEVTAINIVVRSLETNQVGRNAMECDTLVLVSLFGSHCFPSFFFPSRCC